MAKENMKEELERNVPLPVNVVLNTERAKRTPRTYETIESGALALQLSQRIMLCKKLHESIDDEVKSLTIMAENANNMRQGLNGTK